MFRTSVTLFLVTLILTGCSSSATVGTQPAPRPVTVLRIKPSNPGRFNRVTGTVASWKTDQLGFEVAGRVDFVIEPESTVIGDLYDGDGNVLTEGTLLASLNPTRYQLSVAAAKAEVTTAEKQRDALQIELDSVIPAQVDAAQAGLDLANTELERNKNLVAQDAASQRELDLAQSKYDAAVAQMAELAATKAAKLAEIASQEARIQELTEARRQAERDVADCKLYSSYPGQVAAIDVVAGSYVERGEAVTTVQLMDPIKIEFEVAAATARNINHRDQVSVFVPQPDGTVAERIGIVYIIDPTADPQTRTFTVTLLVRNEKSIGGRSVDELMGLARTTKIGKFFPKFAELDKLFVDEPFLHEDGDGHFVYRIKNRRLGILRSDSDDLLEVSKVRVTPGALWAPVLGLVLLREVTIDEGQEFDVNTDMIAGPIILPEGQDSWDGDSLLYALERWLLRPGDLVEVDLRGQSIPIGYYVPLDAIREISGAHYVFFVNASPDGDSARQVPVTVHESVGTLRRIELADDETADENAMIVAEGAAFLVDGEPINVAGEDEVRR